MKFSKSAIVAVAISGLLLAGCSAKVEQPSSGGSVAPSASSQGDMHGAMVENGLMPHDPAIGAVDGYEVGNLDESKAKKIMTSDKAQTIVGVTDNGVLVRTKAGPLYISLNGGSNLQMEPKSGQDPLIFKWEGKQYVGVVSQKKTDKESSGDPLAKDLGDRYVNIYDLDTGKLVNKHKFVVPSEGDAWVPMKQNYPRMFTMEMVNSNYVGLKDNTYGIQVVNPLTGAVVDEITRKDNKLLETFTGVTPDGKIVREMEPGVYGYGSHLFPKGEVATGVNGQYAITVNRETKQTKLYIVGSDAPKEIVNAPVFCNHIPADNRVEPQHNPDQENSFFSPDERYVAFGHSVFDTKDKTLKCLAESGTQESVLPKGIDNDGNIYANDNDGGFGEEYMINFVTGKAVKIRNSIGAITKSGMGVVFGDIAGDRINYFLPVK